MSVLGVNGRGLRRRAALLGVTGAMLAGAAGAVLGAAGAVLGAAGADGRAGAPGADGTRTALAASCVGWTPTQQLQFAALVFEGRMLSGPTVRLGRERVLTSPARMRVSRYLKGIGPRTVRVQTGVTRARRGISVNSEGIEPQAGQRWRIYAGAARQPYPTSGCSGSRRLRRGGSVRR